jgi:hypothetical protein
MPEMAILHRKLACSVSIGAYDPKIHAKSAFWGEFYYENDVFDMKMAVFDVFYYGNGCFTMKMTFSTQNPLKSPKNRPKNLENPLKITQKLLKSTQNRPKSPKITQNRPKTPQNHSKTPQIDAKSFKNTSKTLKNHSNRPKISKIHSKSAVSAPEGLILGPLYPGLSIRWLNFSKMAENSENPAKIALEMHIRNQVL